LSAAAIQVSTPNTRKAGGLLFALTCRMAGVRDFRELAAWKRADELRMLCEELLRNPRVKRDFRFFDQLSEASGAPSRNIAEGFGRFRPKENAQYVRVAKGSLNEILALFIEGESKGYISAADFDRYETAAKRAIGTLVGYLRYLDGCEGPPRTQSPPKRGGWKP
jgi:four helix bundle protein